VVVRARLKLLVRPVAWVVAARSYRLVAAVEEDFLLVQMAEHS